MNKIMKIVAIAATVLIVAAIILGNIAEQSDGPRQSFKFLNSSSETKSVTFEKIMADGNLEEGYYTDKSIEPGQWVIDRLPPGTFKITVWNKDDKFFGEVSSWEVVLPENKSNYSLIYFDLAMNKSYAVVNLNAFYEGNSFAEAMSAAVGTNTGFKVEALYQSGKPFLPSENFTNRRFIDIGDKLPDSVKFGEIVYGLIPVPANISKQDDLLTYCIQYAAENL